MSASEGQADMICLRGAGQIYEYASWLDLPTQALPRASPAARPTVDPRTIVYSDLPNNVKTWNQKYSAFQIPQINATSPPVPCPSEGRVAIVTKRWARDAMDAAASGGLPPDEIAAAYGEVVWSWRRDRGVYPRRPVLAWQR